MTPLLISHDHALAVAATAAQRPTQQGGPVFRSPGCGRCFAVLVQPGQIRLVAFDTDVGRHPVGDDHPTVVKATGSARVGRRLGCVGAAALAGGRLATGMSWLVVSGLLIHARVGMVGAVGRRAKRSGCAVRAASRVVCRARRTAGAVP